MSGNQIEDLVDKVQAAFDRRPDQIEHELDTKEADLLQLRKSCRLLAGADVLLEQGFYTIIIEASFVAIERVVEFKLLEGGVEPRNLPGTHPGVYTEAAKRGILSEHVRRISRICGEITERKRTIKMDSQHKIVRANCLSWPLRFTNSSLTSPQKA